MNSDFSSVEFTSRGGAPSGDAQIGIERTSRDQTPEPTSRGDRLDYIDALRGLAAVQVLLSHSMLAFFPGIAFASPLTGGIVGYLAATPLFFPIDGASAVCIFFVLSGYVLTPLFANSQATSAVHLFARFVRLAIPAAAGCALAAILFQIFGGYNQTAANLWDSQSRWLAEGWRPSADLWFLKDALVNGLFLGFRGASIAQWFGFPASGLAAMSDSYVSPLWTLSIEFYGSIFVLILARSRSWLLLVAAGVVFSRTYLLCFLIGHVAANFRLGDKRPATHWLVAATLATLGILICMAGHFWTPSLVQQFCALNTQLLPPCPMEDPAYLMRVYGATLFTVAVMQCSPARRVLSRKGLRAFGRLSFPIYLTHWPIIFGVGCFLMVVSAPWIGVRAARCLALVASIALATFASAAFERVDQLALRVSRAVRKRKVASVS